MDKLYKAWQWIWRNKERMVLGALVLVLTWQVVKVVRHTTDVFTPPTMRLSKEPPEGITVPGPPPSGTSTKDYSALSVRNPFWVFSQRGESKESSKQEQDTSIQLLKIQPIPGGYSAYIKTKAPKWYKEGEPFESYKVLKIDPKKNEVQVYSEKLGKAITLTVQQ